MGGVSRGTGEIERDVLWFDANRVLLPLQPLGLGDSGRIRQPRADRLRDIERRRA
jgi:hypothetical protein